MELSMAALKLRSAEDIIRAYLSGLGFAKNAAIAGAEKLKDISGEAENGEEIISRLDGLLLKSARKIFQQPAWNNEQLTAALKLGYLTGNGAEKWGFLIFEADKITEEFSQSILENVLLNAPDYHMAHMEPQVIESPRPKSVLKNMFNTHRKAQ